MLCLRGIILLIVVLANSSRVLLKKKKPFSIPIIHISIETTHSFVALESTCALYMNHCDPDIVSLILIMSLFNFPSVENVSVIKSLWLALMAGWSGGD